MNPNNQKSPIVQKERLDKEEIREALDAATPGPWKVSRDSVIAQKDGEYSEELAEAFDMVRASGSQKANLHLIANAPTWLRSLLEKYERKEAHATRQAQKINDLLHELEQVKKERDAYRQELLFGSRTSAQSILSQYKEISQ